MNKWTLKLSLLASFDTAEVIQVPRFVEKARIVYARFQCVSFSSEEPNWKTTLLVSIFLIVTVDDRCRRSVPLKNNRRIKELLGFDDTPEPYRLAVHTISCRAFQ